MNAHGMIMHTTTFGPSPAPRIGQSLRDGATEPEVHFHAATSGTVQRVFAQITDAPSALRIAR
jgi:hypothetical protein